MEEQLVIFELGDEAYGVSVFQVQSILPIQEIVTIPGAPDFVEGVINLRGAVVPVVDLYARFKLPPVNGQARKKVIVIIELSHLKVGLIVDKVTQVTKIPETAVEPPSPLLTSIDTAYLRGIGRLNEEDVVILLDLDYIFSMDEHQALTQTTAIAIEEN